MIETLNPLWKTAIPLLALALPALAAEKTAIDPEVLQLREAAWRAWFAGDETTLRRLLPADFVGINMHGEEIVDLETTIHQAKEFAARGGRLVHLEFPETRAQRHGDGMVFYGRFTVVLIPGGPGLKEQTITGRLTEIFHRRNGRWVHPGWHLDTVGPAP